MSKSLMPMSEDITETLLITGFDENLSAYTIAEYFKNYGNILAISTVPNQGASYGHLTFCDDKATKKVLLASPHIIKNFKITCSKDTKINCDYSELYRQEDNENTDLIVDNENIQKLCDKDNNMIEENKFQESEEKEKINFLVDAQSRTADDLKHLRDIVHDLSKHLKDFTSNVKISDEDNKNAAIQSDENIEVHSTMNKINMDEVGEKKKICITALKNYCKNIQNIIVENFDDISDSESEEVINGVKNALFWLKSHPSASVAEIEELQRKLENIFNPIFTQILKFKK